ncbi:MAG: Spy/CpxP family protein refolding chaperone [Pseudomonadota bacterium]
MQYMFSKFLWTVNGIVAAGIALSMMMAFPGTAQAQDRTITEGQQQQLEQRIADISRQLKLTDAQKEQVQPILRSSMQKQKGIIDRYGISRSEKPNLSFRQMRALRSEMSAQRDDTNSKLSRILSRSQMETLADIQARQREQMRARIRG